MKDSENEWPEPTYKNPPYTKEEHEIALRLVWYHIAAAEYANDHNAVHAWKFIADVTRTYSSASSLQLLLHNFYEEAYRFAVESAKNDPFYQELEKQTIRVHALFTHWLYLSRYKDVQ